MKVCELIQDLLLADPDAEVLMSSDAEGNRIKPMFGGDPYSEVYYDGEDIYTEGDSEDENGDYGTAKPNAIVLWPV
jgi:hypothetical protein